MVLQGMQEFMARSSGGGGSLSPISVWEGGNGGPSVAGLGRGDTAADAGA